MTQRSPAALAPVVLGVASLHSFMPQPQLHKPTPSFSFPCAGCSDWFSRNELYFQAPSDFATIYNVHPLYSAARPITGRGQTIAVLENSDVQPSDVETFRAAFGLSSYSGTFTQIHPGLSCIDPGKNSAETEAALDAEWAGAVAPDAAIELASCADTATNFGAFIAAENLLNTQSPPPIMSLGYAACEAALETAGNAFIKSLWQQAALEGVSVVVAAGNTGAAGCDGFNAVPSTHGLAVNGLASTPFNVAVGGTDFSDTVNGTNSTYWRASNNSYSESASSYIPEMAWNNSCASDILAQYLGYGSGLAFCNSRSGQAFRNAIGGSGGASSIYSKPDWQTKVFGNPNDSQRDVPDISLFASNGFWNHVILFCMSDPTEGGAPCTYSSPAEAFYNSGGGTSFTAAQFAGIQALINQKKGTRQGNPAYSLYALAKSEFGTQTRPNASALEACNANAGNSTPNTCVFHDVTAGSNDLPCTGPESCYQSGFDTYGLLSTSDKTTAYPATAGWDFATGLGTLNVAKLVNAW